MAKAAQMMNAAIRVEFIVFSLGGRCERRPVYCGRWNPRGMEV
jgi:hypothetical protein